MLRTSHERGVSLLMLLLCVVFVQPAECQGSSLRLLVPAYANPCCDGGPSMWMQLTETALVMGADVVLILNPASGPGVSPIDPNFVNDSGQGPLLDFRNAGGTVIGYVGTGWASRSLAEVRDEVDLYFDPVYWRGSGVQVQGIFFDEMSNDLADVGYYQELRDHVRSHDPSGIVVGNPGTTFVNNPSGQTLWTVSDYAESADTLVTFESDAGTYHSAYSPPSWLAGYSAGNFAHIVYSVGEVDRLLTNMSLAIRRKAGYVYFTDDMLMNPYDQIPSYWPLEVDAALRLLFADGFESGDLSSWMPMP